MTTAVGCLGSPEKGASRRPRSRRRKQANALVPFVLRYRYMERLGAGAQGIVHLCDDLFTPGRFVAIKIAHSDADSRKHLEKEAGVLRALRGSPAVPEIRALLYRKGLLSGFVTRYFSGETLDGVIHRADFSTRRAVPLALSTTDAVLDILRRGYLHRDLKPENLLVTRGGHIRILDYGLSCKVDEAPDRGELSGTLGYSSPEQLEARPVTTRSDLFSLGLILYEIATRRPFFACDTRNFRSFMSYRARRLRDPLVLRRVDRELAALIERLVVVDPRLRAGIPEVEARLAELRRKSA